MLKSVEGISETKKRITIEIPADVIERQIQHSLLELQKKSHLPGFRPGKVPLSIIEKKYGKSVESDVMEKLVNEYYQKALTEAGIKPVSQAVIEDATSFERKIPISMTFVVEVMPDIKDIKYEGIKVKELPTDVNEEEINATLTSLAEEKATYESIEEPIAIGDLITVDFDTNIDDKTNKDVLIKVGSGPYPQEFHDSLVGKKKDDSFQTEVFFPEDNQSQYAGKTVKFTITIKDVKRRNIPKIDEDFAIDLGFENLNKLREKIRESLQKAKIQKSKNYKGNQIIDKLIEETKFEIPESMLNTKVNDFIAELRALKNDNRSEEELRKEVLPFAERAVRSFIILKIIGEKEQITVSEEDMKSKIIEISKKNNLSPDDVIKYYIARDGSLNFIEYSIFEDKVLELLINKAQVVEGEQA
ncbi:MAG: trigger factor [Thermodesulfovibrionales bacterium]|nr:trigger factor [Thermodesulfovibrionales bacterium]